MGDFEYILVLPVICLAAFGLGALLLAPWFRGNSRYIGLVSLTGLVMTGVCLVQLWGQWRVTGPRETAFGMVRIDGFGLFFSLVLILVGLLSVLYSMTFLEREEADHGEFHALVLLCLAGMLLMLHTTHLMMMFIGLEIFSLALYVLTGLTRMRVRSVESSLKYFLLGAFSSGFLAYGLALLYGATGSLDMEQIAAHAVSQPSRMLWLGLGLVLIALAFKIAIVPFHQWVPDVYQGAPTNVTGFMAAATKTAAFAVLLRVLFGAFGEASEIWAPLITWLAILTMTVANLIALTQRNVKRLLAFSSIAHAGYLLIAVVCLPEDGIRAILFYLTAYALMTVGAFAVLAAVGRGDAEVERG
ncbi:MAG: NADH-quinone oxidoreductase subunit N, partial [Planctomycetota bacterium]